MSKLIIGIGGQKRAGKNFAAEAIQRSYPDNVEIMSFAAPIKEMLQYLFRHEVPEGTFIDDDKKQKLVAITDTSALAVRTLLQKVGTDCFREKIHPDFWVYRALMAIGAVSAPVIIFPDVRFKNELETIKKMGGYTIFIERAGYVTQVDPHPSEQELLSIRRKFDYDLQVPDGALSLLRSMAIGTYCDIIKEYNEAADRE